MKFSVLGSTGFIGRHLVKYLLSLGHDTICPSREDLQNPYFFENEELGHVFYCIGMTANFRSQPLNTINAHNLILHNVLQLGQFQSLTYCSSTRVYEASVDTNEVANLIVNSNNIGHIYNLSKLLGESMCINSDKNTKIVRLSNVYGLEEKTDNFLSSVLNEATSTGNVTFATSADSSKDYISVNDVVTTMLKIATQGKYKIYNVASGANTDNKTISDFLIKSGINTCFAKSPTQWIFPTIDNTRITNEFNLTFRKLEWDLPILLNHYYQKARNND